ncbi:helix-turn-helix domain-containing protein [Actinokineospora bangkokensis]|uniref:Uncharacterized protein n=1 Tax=Actinokineospora bangkokensis TaxID=1193682 RepID=A0A1Q9LJU2_9PSEU|nr:hypothetical protein [Actinokineospora bangkokensis]OLR92273.1 hypothetical protein BJP25_23455 [Actinokineospora bangkokensis]
MTRSPAPRGEVVGAQGFSETLRAAITRRDLTLQRLRSRLADRGVDISLATLSYWQQGRSRPERDKSLRALRELELILDLPRDTLFDLLEPPRPRGRTPASAGVTGSQLYGADSPFQRVLGGSFDDFNAGVVALNVASTCTLDADGCLRRVEITQVLRAVADGQDRFLVAHGVDEGEVMPSDLVVRDGTLLDLVADHANGYLAAEIHLGRTLARNETAVVEYATELGPSPAPARLHEHRFRTPVHGFLQRVRFHEARLPVRCHSYFRDAVPAPPTRKRRLVPDGSHVVHAFQAKCGPGVHGIAWQWG